MDTNENNLINGENTKKKNNKKIILITIAVLVVVTIGIIAIASSGVFKSKGEKFVELLTKEQYVVEMIENRTNDFNIDGETNYNLALKKNFLATIDSTFALLGNDLILNTNVIKQGKTSDTKASLKLGTFELQRLEVIKENNVVALSVPNLFENFVAISNENTEEVAKKLGFIESGETIEPDEEVREILKRYSKIFMKSISEYIVVQDNVEVNINENTFNTKEYILTLREKELNQIGITLLERLKDDDEAIKIISKYINENYTEISGDALKEEIVNSYNQLLENSANIANESKIVEIKLNVLDNKTIKTTLNINETTEIVLYTNVKEDNDYVALNLNVDGTVMNLEYTGAKQNENYSGTATLKAAGETITVLEMSIEKVQNSQSIPRKISELNALLLNEATDAEIAKLRREIERNLGISNEEELEDTIYEEGEFKLNNPEARVNVLEDSVAAYNKLNLGMTRDEIINIMGEPSASFEVNERENMGWYFDENNSIYYISLELTDGKASKIYNDIVSDMEDNVQVSAELGTEIEDLTTLVSSLEYSMTKAEVINLLGDKYLEISKDEEGFKTYKWYDKRENILVIEFDNEEKVSYVNTVTMDI